MGTLHEEIVISDDSLSFMVCSSVDDHILADNVIVAYDALTFLATEFKVLRQCSDDRTLMYFVVLPDTRTIEDTSKREDDAVVADDHITLDVCEREYLTIVADLRPGVDFGSWTDVTCHISIFMFYFGS